MNTENRPKQPTIARIWRGRTKPERADEYEAYNDEVGIKPLIEKAMGVQTFREDRPDETEFITLSYWENVEAMSAFTSGDPTDIHHLARDEEFLSSSCQRACRSSRFVRVTVRSAAIAQDSPLSSAFSGRALDLATSMWFLPQVPS